MSRPPGAGDPGGRRRREPRRLSAGVVPVWLGEGGPRYLLLRAFRNWDFPKGEVEEGEEPLDAARRELVEETGIGEVAFAWGTDFAETGPYAGGKVARYYLGRSPTREVVLPASPELGRPEHHEYRWVTADEARALLGPRLRPVLEWADARVRGAPPCAAGSGSPGPSGGGRSSGGRGSGASSA